MSNRERVSDNIKVVAEGIGGIDSTTVRLKTGVNLLEGRNATNRTSFLQAIMAALGSDNVSLKGDRDEGYVELEIGGETYTRKLRRENGEVQFSGDPYLSNSTEADLFAFLLETNEARKVVTNRAELREVIMRPVDTTDIERQIVNHQEELRAIDEKIENLETQRERLPGLEDKRARIEAKLEETREALADTRADLESADNDVADRREEQERLEDTLSDLSGVRSTLDDVQYRLETEREALTSARDELEAAKEMQDTQIDTPDRRLEEIEAEIDRLRNRKRACDSRVSKLHRMVQFNEEMLDGESVLGDLLDESQDAITDELLGEGETTCWTCGSSVEKTEIEGMLERLRELSQSQRRERRSIEEKLGDLTDERDSLESDKQELAELNERIDGLKSDIERREETIEDLDAQRKELRDRIGELEEKAEALEGVSESRVIELHKTVNEKEATVERLEREKKSVTEKIEDLEASADRITELERTRHQVSEQLTELRTRIDRLEEEALEAFNEHMAALVDILQFDNLSRVWIERKTETETGSRGGDSSFTLHVVRTADDGSAYEDTLDHLSESEREVAGVVFALSGYLVHEVYEIVPLILLDSLEAIDAERIALLIEYIAEYAPTVVAALLREDAQMLEDSHHRIEEI